MSLNSGCRILSSVRARPSAQCINIRAPSATSWRAHTKSISALITRPPLDHSSSSHNGKNVFAPTTPFTTARMGSSTAYTPVTAENVMQLFPDVQPHLGKTHNDSEHPDKTDLSGYDPEQIRLMDEVCIILDNDDRPIGSASKKTCHLMTNIDRGLLHRAFSVFLFDSQNRLLLQQRASEKITFPDMWTNTCCSHPLGVPGETGTELEEAVMGAKRAGQRKLDHELGIKAAQVPLDKFKFLTRIHYQAPSNGPWGEHEIDYILFIKADVDLDISPNEVQAVDWVTPEQLKAKFEDTSLKFTPWFKLICNSMLFEWWPHLDSGLENYMNETQIRRM